MNKILISFIVVSVCVGLGVGIYFIIDNSMSKDEKINYYNKNKNVKEEISYDERLKFYFGELYEIDKNNIT